MAHTVVLTLDSNSRGGEHRSYPTLHLFGFKGGGTHSPNSYIRFIGWVIGREVAYIFLILI